MYASQKFYLLAVCFWIWKWFMIQFIQSPLIWNATSIIYWFIYVLRLVYKHLKIIRQLVPLLLLRFKIILVHINIILIVTIIIINPIIILIATIYWPWLHIVFKYTMPNTFTKPIWFVFQMTPWNRYNYYVYISAKETETYVIYYLIQLRLELKLASHQTYALEAI